LLIARIGPHHVKAVPRATQDHRPRVRSRNHPHRVLTPWEELLLDANVAIDLERGGPVRSRSPQLAPVHQPSEDRSAAHGRPIVLHRNCRAVDDLHDGAPWTLQTLLESAASDPARKNRHK